MADNEHSDDRLQRGLDGTPGESAFFINPFSLSTQTSNQLRTLMPNHHIPIPFLSHVRSVIRSISLHSILFDAVPISSSLSICSAQWVIN
jgi:hypothetical protein